MVAVLEETVTGEIAAGYTMAGDPSVNSAGPGSGGAGGGGAGGGGASRPPLNAPALRAAIVRPGGLWRDARVVAQTGSTNADLLAEAAGGSPEGTVLVAEAQSAGRGRLSRNWISQPRSALLFSVLLRPAQVPAARWGWVPLLAGVAAASALRAGASVGTSLKWPNDVLVGGAKLAGILAEHSGGAIVVGIGINVSASRAELPGPGATSLALEGASSLDRGQLLATILAGLERWYLAWSGAFGDADASGLRAEYRRLCQTLGQQVRVIMPGGRELNGAAADVDPDGRLIVSTPAGPCPVTAGDVLHVR
jgi:BirA family transcriptional regulator, biotin operon repressor / biotin---[acetyl-CoA-carboxylase] ligase